MKRLKKIYCLATFFMAIVAVVLTLSVSFERDTVYASSLGQGMVTQDGQNGGGTGAGTTGNNGNGISFSYNNEDGSLTTPIKTLLVLTVLALAPSILILLTSYTRIIIVLHFARTAIGTQSTPPNQIMVGLALFLTIFIMWPTMQQINETAIKPLDNGEITTEEAFAAAQEPIRDFMFRDLQEKDLKLFVDIAEANNVIEIQEYQSYEELQEHVPMVVVVPAFIIGELRQAFIMGFVIYIPFIVIDMVVSSVLMSMGMMMLPPTTISLPFKILLFILADGWSLLIENVVNTFY